MYERRKRMAEWRRGSRWFAAEFLVVVAGVLVALAVQALYERGQDARREKAYLRQLAAELEATEAAMLEADAFTAGSDRAGVELLRAYRAPAPPDSILAWLNDVSRFAFHLPVTGTAEALVTSGDLRLIRNDSLRGAITAYVGRNRPNVQTMENAIGNWQDARQELARRVDLNEAASRIPARAGQKQQDPAFSPLPPEAAGGGFPIDTDVLLRDREAYAALDAMNSAKYVASLMRTNILEQARALRADVEEELERR